MINFVYQPGAPYSSVLDAIIDPILEHLPTGSKSSKGKPDALNVRFFVESEREGVFIPHGIADKNYRNADKLVGFDYVSVSGPAWVDKLTGQGFPREKIFIGGYSKLDPAFQGKFRRRFSSGRPTVLHAPTHGAIEKVSIHGHFNGELEALSEHYEVICSTHPTHSGNVTMQAMVDADVVIVDSGSLLYEAWALGKPVVFPDWLVKEGVLQYFPGSFEEQIYREGIGYHADTFKTMLKAIERALQEGIDDKAKVFIDGIFPPELRGRSGEVTAKFLKERDI
jgi:CDP-glycerol glycerophosphotransferase (TagB/SpsB family)